MAASMRTLEELQKLRVVDLRKELSSLALPTGGKKDELVHRLHDYLVEQSGGGAPGEGSPESATTDEGSPPAEEEPMETESADTVAEAETEPEPSISEPEPSTSELGSQESAEMEQQQTPPESVPTAETPVAEPLPVAEPPVAEPPVAEPPVAEPPVAIQPEQPVAAETAENQQPPASEEPSEEPTDSQMMALVEQQQNLLRQQKLEQDSRQHQVRKLAEQRQQLEGALRQNSDMLEEHKGNLAVVEQLHSQRQQLIAQGEAISSMQSSLSEDSAKYQDQRMLNEQLIRQVMEQDQRKEAETQRLLLERQQKLVAEQQLGLLAMQQAAQNQRQQAELLQQQQLALLVQQREQETAIKQAIEAKQREEAARRAQLELQAQQQADLKARQEAELKTRQEAELKARQEAEIKARQEAEQKAREESEKKAREAEIAEQRRMQQSDSSDNAADDSKLPKALEDVLSYKDVRAKQVGVDMEQALTESHSMVTAQPKPQPKVPPPAQQQLPLGDVNEYDDDEEEEEGPTETVAAGKESKNKRRKKKKKTRAQRKAEEKKAAEQRSAAADAAEDKEREDGMSDSGIEVEYVQEKPLVDITDPLYSQFHKIFETFKIEEAIVTTPTDDVATEKKQAEKSDSADSSNITKRGAAHFGELEENEVKPDRKDKLSKKQLKKMNRMTVAQLKTVVTRPDLVEMHDVTGPDPKLLLALKATRNTVPVPRHWCNKRKYLQGKRGFEKPPFELPDYIQATGIMEMRQALADKEEQKSLKQKMREKVRPKMGKIDIDYQKLHDAFFKFQRKPRMTVHGDLYYEGKEFETKLKEKKPGNLSDDLRTALGMPIGAGSEKFPPPWLIAMQRYGPPPSYPNLRIPGLNAAIPEGCSFGYHAGGWGKPPVDETGKPLYGDVFGQKLDTQPETVTDVSVDRARWGEMESESEEESESESEEERDEDDIAAGLVTPGEAGLITPSGMTSIPAGMETPDAIELRKRIEDQMESGGGDTPALYQVLPEKKTSVGAAMMGSAHTYDVGGAKRINAEGIEVTLNPEELDMDTTAMQAKYEQTMRAQQSDVQKEDFSDMVAEHSAKAAKKRKKQQTTDKASKKHKEFKF